MILEIQPRREVAGNEASLLYGDTLLNYH